MKIVPPKWRGYSKVTGKTIDLTDEFVHKNFAPGFLESLQQMASRNRGAFIEVPPGDSKQHAPQENSSSYPKNKYCQLEGEKVCLVLSFANLLHHCNSRHHASLLFNACFKILKTTNIWESFQEKLISYSTSLKLQRTNKNIKCCLENGSDVPFITCLRGSDYKEDHTVSIYQKWIFDGNFETALPLTKASLDECCSTDTKNCTFVEFVNSFSVPNFKPYLEKYMVPDKQDLARRKKI